MSLNADLCVAMFLCACLDPTVTIYFSLFYADPLQEAPLAVVTIIVVLLNVVTILVFLTALTRAAWHMMLQMLKLSPEVRAKRVSPEHLVCPLSGHPCRNNYTP